MFWSKLSVEKLDRKGKAVYNNRVSPQGLSTMSGTTSLTNSMRKSNSPKPNCGALCQRNLTTTWQKREDDVVFIT